MTERPQQPPEGRLIAAALERSGLSIREASKRAGISYGRWRQVVTGVQHVSPGNYAAVHAPAKTVAKMALAAGVTPEQMETEGHRPDAAEAMRTTTREREERAGAAPLAAVLNLPSPAAADESETINGLRAAAVLLGLEDQLPRIEDEALGILARALDAGGRAGTPDPPGAAIFGDTPEAATWDRQRRLLSPAPRAWFMALARVKGAGGSREPGRSSGLAAGRAPAGTMPRVLWDDTGGAHSGLM